MAGAVGLLAFIVIWVQVNTGEQRANNWINGTGAAVALLNVILTFYLLRTAQIQLHAFREDLEDQQLRHDKELAEREARRAAEASRARDDLNNLQRLLNTQTDALALARSDAQEAQRETAMARYDNTAPRCLVRFSGLKTLVCNRSSDEWRRPNPEEAFVGLDETILKLTIQFELKNWGDLPATYSVGSDLSPNGDGIVDPDSPVILTWEMSRNLRWWKEVHEGKASIDDRAEYAQLVQLQILVQNVGCDVTDVHKWDTFLSPVIIQEFGVQIKDNDEIARSLRLVAIPTRTYIHLHHDE